MLALSTTSIATTVDTVCVATSTTTTTSTTETNNNSDNFYSTIMKMTIAETLLMIKIVSLKILAVP